MTEKNTEDNSLPQNASRRMSREELICEVMKGVNEIREGRFRTYESGAELAEEVIRRGKARLRAKKKQST